MQVKDTNRNQREFGIVALVCLVVQIAIAPNIALGNGRANVMLVFAGAISMLVGGRSAVLYSFLAGLAFDLSTTGPIGLMALLLTVASFVMSMESRNRFTDGVRPAVMSFAWFAAAVSLAYHMTMLFVGQAGGLIDVLFFRTVPTLILTVLFFVPLAFMYVRTSSTGPSLSKSSRSSVSGPSRYDIGNL